MIDNSPGVCDVCGRTVDSVKHIFSENLAGFSMCSGENEATCESSLLPIKDRENTPLSALDPEETAWMKPGSYRYSSTLKELDSGKLYLEIPEEVLRHLWWEDGDTVVIKSDSGKLIIRLAVEEQP